VQTIIPSLSPYPGQITQALQFVQASSNNSGDYAVAWNETVTSSTGGFLGDQIEFAVFKTGTGVIKQVEFQTDGNAQNIRVGEFTDPVASTTQDDVVVVYGDDTGTHILEYGITGGGTAVNLLESITAPATTAFGNMTVMGDGRIAISYDDLVNPSPDQTSQYDFQIFDLRTQGLNATLTASQNNYVSGTQYSDTVTGAAGVNNLYDFVGQDTAVGSGPSDHFAGGSGGWNIAVFSDARSDYTITTQIESGPNITTIASNGADSQHTGSLAVTNVEFLAFNPASDPTPHNGVIDVNGGTDVILGGNSPVTIEAGSTAELYTAASGSAFYSGLVTFEADTGVLQIDSTGTSASTSAANPFSIEGTGTGGTGHLSTTDIIDLPNTAFDDPAADSYNANTGCHHRCRCERRYRHH
jgi:hypothetical protein